jgi:hypothetical protein
MLNQGPEQLSQEQLEKMIRIADGGRLLHSFS